jgi:hypothetical protein
MKRLIHITLLLFFGINYGFSQSDSLIIPMAKNQTLLEQTLNSVDFLLKKEVIPAGNLRGYTFDVMKVSNLENFQQVSGIRINQDFPAGTLSKQAISIKTYLDSKEVEDLLTTLNYMRTVVKMTGYPENYTEIYFNSLSGSQLVLYISQPSPMLKRWGLAFQINTNINKTFTNLYINDIDSLITLLEAAKAKF